VRSGQVIIPYIHFNQGVKFMPLNIKYGFKYREVTKNTKTGATSLEPFSPNIIVELIEIIDEMKTCFDVGNII